MRLYERWIVFGAEHPNLFFFITQFMMAWAVSSLIIFGALFLFAS